MHTLSWIQNKIALCYKLIEKYDQAIDFVNEAVNSDSHNSKAFWLGGSCYVIEGMNWKVPDLVWKGIHYF